MAVTGSMEIAEIEAQIPIAQFRGLAHVDRVMMQNRLLVLFFANIV